MNITLNDAQYRRLLTLTLMGEWMMNAIRKEPDMDYEEVASVVYAAAAGTPHETLVQQDEENVFWIPSAEFEEEVHAHIDEYDDKTFWEDLTARMTERDMMFSFGEATVKSMRPEQREREAKPIATAYSHEFEEKGLDRLFIDETQP